MVAPSAVEGLTQRRMVPVMMRMVPSAMKPMIWILRSECFPTR